MTYNKEYHAAYYQANKEKKQQQAKDWALRNPEKHKAIRDRVAAKQRDSGASRAATKRWEARNRERVLWNAARNRAKANGLDFTITVDDIKIPDNCPLLDIPINRNERGRMQNNSPSLDRIDSNGGYTPENVWVISWRANRIKCDATPQELTLIADRLSSRIVG